MATSTLRSTNLIAEYLSTVDDVNLAAVTLTTLQSRERALRPKVIEQVGDVRAVMHDGTVRMLRVIDKESYQLAVSESDAVQYCVANHVPIDRRSELWISPAKRTKYGKERLLPQSILEIRTERILTVD